MKDEQPISELIGAIVTVRHLSRPFAVQDLRRIISRYRVVVTVGGRDVYRMSLSRLGYLSELKDEGKELYCPLEFAHYDVTWPAVPLTRTTAFTGRIAMKKWWELPWLLRGSGKGLETVVQEEEWAGTDEYEAGSWTERIPQVVWSIGFMIRPLVLDPEPSATSTKQGL